MGRSKFKHKPSVAPKDVELPNDKEGREAEEISDTAARMAKVATNAKYRNNRLGIKSDRNDPDWYDNIPGLIDPVGRLPYYYPIGSKTTTTAGDFIIPGVMSFKFIPTYGINGDDESSALNQALARIYTYLRKNNARLTFDNPDFGCYLIAMDNLYMYHAYMERAYGILQNFQWANQYTPRALITAMGMDYDDLLKNMPQLLFHLRDVANKLSSLPVPDVLDIFKRHDYLARNYFCDGDSLKCQFYVPQIGYLWKFVNTAATGSSCQLVPFCGTAAGDDADLATLATCKAVFEQLYTAVLLDNDIQTIGGAVLHAYESAKIRGVGPTSQDYIALPVYNDLTLEQIKNMDAVNGVLYEEGTTITQTNAVNHGALITKVGINVTQDSSGSVVNAENAPKRLHMINTMLDDPTPLDNIEITRLMYNIEGGTWTAPTGYVPFNVTACGAEVVYNTYVITDPNKPYVINENVFHFHSHVAITTGVNNKGVETLAAVSQFHGHPSMYYYKQTDSTLTFIGIMRNVENYTFISNSDLSNLHDAAMRSLFYTDLT